MSSRAECRLCWMLGFSPRAPRSYGFSETAPHCIMLLILENAPRKRGDRESQVGVGTNPSESEDGLSRLSSFSDSLHLAQHRLAYQPGEGFDYEPVQSELHGGGPSKGLHSRLGASRELPSAGEMKKFQTALA